MNISVLSTIFGSKPTWHGPCHLVVDADADVKSSGSDSIVTGGTKMYAPRVSSGRIIADHVAFLPDQSTLLVVQRVNHRDPTGEERWQQHLLFVAAEHVVSIEFTDTALLAKFGLQPPPIPDRLGYAPGTLVG